MVGDWPPNKMNLLAEQVNQAALHNRDQSASWRRWVMASCLSINGGAAIAILNLPKSGIYEWSRLWAIGWLTGGLLASILFGICAAILMGKLSIYFQHSAWLIANKSIADACLRDEKLEISKFEELQRWENRIFGVQFIGLICFVMGVAVAVEGLK